MNQTQKKTKKSDLTVRERSKGNARPKRRHLRASATVPMTIWRYLLRFVKAVFRPFKPVARIVTWPLRTRALRAVGRFLAKVLLINYFISAWQELKDVTWPDRRETRQLTLAVFAFAIVFGLLIAVVDYGLDKLFKQFILK